MGDLVNEVRGDEAGTLTGEAAAATASVGEGTEEGSWTGAGEVDSGLLVAGEGDGVDLCGFISSGRNGSEKKRAPGDLTRFI